MLDKMKQLYELQKKAREMQKELKNTEIEAASRDGKVRVILNAELHIQSVQIDESMLEAGNRRGLEETIKNVFGEALSRAQAIAAEKSKAMMKGMNLNIPGL